MGGGRQTGSDAEQGLEGSHWSAPAVEPENELIEVDLQLELGDSAVGAPQPGLQVADHAVDTGQHLSDVFTECQPGSLALGLVIVAEPGQPLVPLPGVGLDRGAQRNVVLYEPAHAVC